MRIDFREEYISQIPALQLLMNMGYTYLTPVEANQKRGNKLSNVILTDILREWLQQNNAIDYRGQVVPFSEKNIQSAIRELEDYKAGVGLNPENKRIYELLTLGTSLEQTIDGNKRSYSLHYIDWHQPQNNVYHITDEYKVHGSPNNSRPDIVLFVNGIPLVVIECKRPDKNAKHGGKSVSEGITQMIRNQKRDYIPRLFAYSQLLLSVATSDARYATTYTPEKFWQLWKEEADIEPAVKALINQPLTDAQKDRLYMHRDRAHYVRHYFDEQAA